jgi:hypothetical protein
MTEPTPYCTPWSLHFESDGTEEYAVVRDAEGRVLAESSTFWIPQQGDPTPAALAAIRLMAAAPRLMEALHDLLAETVDMDLKYGIGLSEGEEDAREMALSAIAAVTGEDA